LPSLQDKTRYEAQFVSETGIFFAFATTSVSLKLNYHPLPRYSSLNQHFVRKLSETKVSINILVPIYSG
jgi:hypothetical protein